MAPPILLLVQHALPPHIQAIPHAVQLVNEFVLPSTIDAAVYNDLQRVLEVFQESRPYTVGAMDGAAARGKDAPRHLLAPRLTVTWTCWSGSTIATRSSGKGCKNSRKLRSMAIMTLSSTY
ncbi:hypothetical protein PHYSODRAFT_332121 [Phytophthora sojae]|uniref:Uncharacterized protein n=1 Tax=Phytophthora sojae (strain P6497) TaxID=1094619 RepID=G4ZCU0_PHYSP|nr:hypothetical protein PHYSODRAFT_332121 [Phytophthora sojae]EGZ18298.1 hypothetical protein PHYSODRAFT_332121 [Phytophthora sojae]|eukprot:XP_009527356.1 hypothetical protein PHYSODRAFT_332121 [Phytophthora sojae]